jgi:hypothetical protein
MKYYLYGKVDENGRVIDTFSRPNWFFDDGSIVTDDILAKDENIYPINTTLSDTIDFIRFVEVQNDKSEFILDTNTNIIENYYSYIPRSLEDILHRVLSDINNIKESKIYSNVFYKFPDNTTGFIQLRDIVDLSNIRSLGFNAAVLNPNGIFEFIDEFNVIHEMTSKQILEMLTFIENRIQNIYKIAYDHKRNVKSLNDINLLLDYDTHFGWHI